MPPEDFLIMSSSAARSHDQMIEIGHVMMLAVVLLEHFLGYVGCSASIA
ncbi:hypothetical protein Galf_1409 [Gallionella capsiferriformans ES-2]|jgi:hypothetical protein|uniref:Uncharacterized protein n=1 Tax=Gallionella capsiferriformans (strain ES-2) TaxID=395494 RepID=D9SFY8_GALCS|nr:hypothetical protein Galf_1409 [Gallionella capsiferriformans ES-2]